MNNHQLRLNGYIVNEGGCIMSDREGERFEQARVSIVEIHGDRAIVDLLLSIADSPRALVGRDKDHCAVLLFRRDGERNFLPYIQNHRSVFDLVMHSDGEPLRLVFGCETLDPSTWTWAKGRSPADVPRDSLPILTGDVCDEIAREALMHAGDAQAAREEAERTKAFEERRAKYLADLAKPKTPEQLLQAEDDKIIARYVGEVLAFDDPDKPRLDAARARLAKRTVAA